jgi:hypothetical protein
MVRLFRVRNLLVIAVVLFAMGAVYNAMHMTQGLKGGMNDTVLASADYRAAIVDIEALLFSYEPISMEDRIRLSKAFEDLRVQLEQRNGSNLVRFSAREVRTLAGLSQGLGPLGGADLDRVRTNWMRVRSNIFDDASWFRFSEADPVPPREEKGLELGPADRAALERLKTALAHVERAIERGQRDVERLGEPDASWTDAQGEPFAAAWQTWAGDWGREIESLRGDLPPQPAAEAPVGYRFAFTSASDAIDELASVPRDTRGRWRTPLRYDWEHRFQSATKRVRDARFYLDRAERGLGV